MPGVTKPKPTKTRRSASTRGTRETVAEHARQMFAARGYPAVRMEDIATAMGMTARALYRHYPNKNALLFHVCFEGQDLDLAAVESADDDAGTPVERLQRMHERLAAVTMSDGSQAVLWQRESRHLDPDNRRIIRQRLRQIAGRLSESIAAARDEQPGRDTELLGWAVFAVLASSGHHPQPPARDRAQRVLADVATEVAIAELAPGGSSPTGFRTSPTLAARREQLLTDAARLFRARGYVSVTLEEIGKAAEILGPSIYHHFPSKSDILVTLVNRLHDWLSRAILEALGSSDDPAEQQRALINEYIELAIRFPDLISVGLTEMLYLPEDDGPRLRRIRADLFAEWIDITMRARPGLDKVEATLRVYAAVALVDDLVRTRQLRDEQLSSDLHSLMCTVLGPAS